MIAKEYKLASGIKMLGTKEADVVQWKVGLGQSRICEMDRYSAITPKVSVT